MIQLAFKGLRGRKRDSIILGGILLLAFLFLTLSSILLASFAETARLERQALHGDWQLIYYGASAEAEQLCAQQTDCGTIRVVGTTQDNHLVGSIDETVMDLGNLTLTEGRLPQGEDEIVLVRGRMPSEPALGEEISAVYLYTYMQGSSSGWISQQEGRRDSVVESLRYGDYDLNGVYYSWYAVEEAFLQYVVEHYLPDQNAVSFDPNDKDSNLFCYLEPGTDLDMVLEDDPSELLYDWAVMIRHPDDGAFDVRIVRSKPGALYGIENFLINVKGESVQSFYSGWDFAPYISTESASETQTSETLIYKTYTVVGYIDPYADHWDVRGLTMPDAFVSNAAADAQLRAIRRAEEDYYEGAPSFEPTEILLLSREDAEVEETIQRILPVFSSQQKPYFKVEGLSNDMMDGHTALLIGLDPETGEEKICNLTKYGSIYYLNEFDSNQYCAVSGDPTVSSRWEEFSEMLLPLNAEELTLEELERNNTHPLRLNQFSYPPSDAEKSLQTLCGSVLIGVAACAVFQVFWVQLRRRQKRLTTLMAVGATDAQVLTMLLVEIVLLLVLNGVLGTGLGFLLARVLTTKLDTCYTVQWGRLLGGILLCVAAVSVSALIPMLLVLRAPLTGREQVSHRTLNIRAPKKLRRQSWRRLILRQLRVNRGRTVLQLSMAFLLSIICLMTLFLCHNAYAGYRRSVEGTAMPDYELVVPYGMSTRYYGTVMEEHETLWQMMDVSVSREAPNIKLTLDEKLRQSPIVHALTEMPDASFGKDALAVRVIGLDDNALDALLDSEPGLSVDRDAIRRGEACLLLVPRYAERDGKVLTRTTDETELEKLRMDERSGYLLSLYLMPRYESVTQVDSAVGAGDMLHLSASSRDYTDDAFIDETKELNIRVEAVLSALNVPRWPLSEQCPAYVVISGISAVPALYPSANTRMTAEQTRYHAKMSAIFYPDSYGLTRILLSNRTQDDPTAMDTMAYNLAESLGVDLINYRLTKQRIQDEAQNKYLLFLLLGIEMVLVLSTLLYAAAMMAVEQDRDRYGLLQALGLSDRRIFTGQLWQGLGIAVLGCLGANLILGVVLLFSALFSEMPMLHLMESLDAYPWKLHLLVCLCSLVVYALLQALPIWQLSKVQPIENMRS